MKVGKFFQLVALILIAAGAQPAYSAFWQWSKTAATNASADPSINWAEGMSPSSVNDSARAMMARAAEYRDDISGLLAASGTALAFTVTTNQGLASTPNDGQLLSFRSPITNAGGVTLQADGGGVFPIISISTAGLAAPIPGATLIAGNPYTVMFSTLNSAWEIHGFYGASLTVPLGGIVPYTGTTVPNSNFVFAAGQCLSTTTYAAYWNLLGSPASGSCAGGQFRIINMSGYTVAGLDTMPGFSAANNLTSSSTGCGTAMTTVGSVCANGVQGSVIPLAQLPTGIASAVTQSISVAVTTTGVPSGMVAGSQPATGGIQPTFFPGALTTGTPINASGSNTINVTSNNTSGAARPNVPPIIGVTMLLRVI